MRKHCKTIQLKLVNIDLSLTQLLRVTIGLHNILEGCSEGSATRYVAVVDGGLVRIKLDN